MTEPVFILPVGAGIATVIFSFVLFKSNSISSRYFAISLLFAGLLVISPVIFSLFEFIKDFFGIRFTFVLAFGVAIVGIILVIVYLLLIIGKLRNEIVTLWQEIALVESEREDSKPPKQ